MPISRRARIALSLLAISLLFAELSTAAAQDSPAERADAAALAALDARLDFDFQDTPLADVVAFIGAAARVHVDLDGRALEEVGVDMDSPVNFKARDFRLASALRLMLRELDLTFDVRDGAILITSHENIEDKLITRVYPVGDLLEADGDAPFPADDPHAALIDVVTTAVRSTTWEEVGGVGAIRGFGKTLVVAQTREVHAEVAELLAALAEAIRLAEAGGVPATAFLPRSDDELSADEAKIMKALDGLAELSCIEKPLGDVIDELAERAGITMRIDHKSLEEVGIGVDTPVTRNIKGVTLRSVLRLMLKEFDLTYVVRDDVLLVTSPEESESSLLARIFPVADLVRASEAEESLDADPNNAGVADLIEVITANIRDTSWEEVGGPGQIKPYGTCLLVAQTPDVLDEITPLLVALRKIQALARETPERAVTEIVALDEVAQPALGELRAKLQAELGMLALGQMPLPEALAAMGEKCGVRMLIDNRALEEAGIAAADTVVSASLGGESLAQALRRVLRGTDLTWVLQNEVLLITTHEDAEEGMSTRAYAVGDLVDGREALEVRRWRKQLNRNYDYEWEVQSVRAAAYDDLVHTISNTIQANTWESVGGPGAIEEFPPAKTLVVTQSREAHDEIAALVADMRKTQAAADGEPVDDDSPSLPEGPTNKAGERLHLKVYKLKSTKLEDALAIAETMRELVAPESWKSGELYVGRGLTGVVVVRHTAKTHRAIYSLLTKLDALAPPLATGGSFGGSGNR